MGPRIIVFASMFFVLAQLCSAAAIQETAEMDAVDKRPPGYKVPFLNIPYPSSATPVPRTERDVNMGEVISTILDPRGASDSKPATNDIPQDNGVLKIPSWYMPNRAFAGRYRPSRDINWGDVISVLRDPRDAEPTTSDIPQDNGVLKIPPWYMPNRAFAGRYRPSRSIIEMEENAMAGLPFDLSLIRPVRGASESKPANSDIPQDNGVLKISPWYMPNRAFSGRYRPTRSIVEDQAGSVMEGPFEFIFGRSPRDTQEQQQGESNLIIPPWYMPNRAFAGRYANRQPRDALEQKDSNLIIPSWYMPNRAFAGRYANRQPQPQQ